MLPSIPHYTNTTHHYYFLDNEDVTGSLFEVLGGWVAQTRWQRAGGHGFPTKKPYSPEDVVAKWKNITSFGVYSLLLEVVVLRPHYSDF